MRHHALVLAAGGLLATGGSAQDPSPTLQRTLTAANVAAWRDHIRAQPAERAWAELPWRMTFHDGLQAAAAAGRPLLLWAMNGHPFGCT